MKKNITPFMKSISLFVVIMTIGFSAFCQNPAYQITSTTGGFVAPSMTKAQRVALSNVNGNIVYQTDAPAGFPAGYYYYDGAASAWKQLATTNTGGVNEQIYTGIYPSLAAGAYNGGFTSFNFTGPGTFFFGPGQYIAGTAATEYRTQIKMPKCIVTRLRVMTAFGNWTTAAVSAVTVRKNGVNTTLVCNVPAAAPLATYYEGTDPGVAFADGDLLSVQHTWVSGGAGFGRIEITYYPLP